MWVDMQNFVKITGTVVNVINGGCPPSWIYTEHDRIADSDGI